MRPLLLLSLVVLCACPQAIRGEDEGDARTTDDGGSDSSGGDSGGPADAGDSGGGNADAGTRCPKAPPRQEPCESAGPGDRIAIFRHGTWIIDSDRNFQYSETCDETFTYGEDGDQPIAGDWTRTGRVDVGVFRDGTWILDTDHDRRMTECDSRFVLGHAGDVAVTGLFTAGWRVQYGYYSPDTQTWHLDLDDDGAISAIERFSFGEPGARPVVGDWAGHGEDELGFLHPESPNNAFWSLDVDGSRSWTQGVDDSISFGLAADLPVAGDWLGSGSTRIGTWRPSDGSWTLEKSLSGNPGDSSNWIQFTYGLPGDVPVVMRR